MIIQFLESADKSDVRWYSSRLGDTKMAWMFFSKTTLVKEFELDSGLEAEADQHNRAKQRIQEIFTNRS